MPIINNINKDNIDYFSVFPELRRIREIFTKEKAEIIKLKGAFLTENNLKAFQQLEEFLEEIEEFCKKISAEEEAENAEKYGDEGGI